MKEEPILGNRKGVRIKVILSDPFTSQACKRHHCQKQHYHLLFLVYHKYMSFAVKIQWKASIALAWPLGEGFPCLVPSGASAAPVQRQSWLVLPRFGCLLLKTAIKESLFFSSKRNQLSQSVLLAWIFEQKSTKALTAVPQVLMAWSDKLPPCANLSS